VLVKVDNYRFGQFHGIVPELLSFSLPRPHRVARFHRWDSSSSVYVSESEVALVLVEDTSRFLERDHNDWSPVLAEALDIDQMIEMAMRQWLEREMSQTQQDPG
jgi:hypothetical protein